MSRLTQRFLATADTHKYMCQSTSAVCTSSSGEETTLQGLRLTLCTPTDSRHFNTTARIAVVSAATASDGCKMFKQTSCSLSASCASKATTRRLLSWLEHAILWVWRAMTGRGCEAVPSESGLCQLQSSQLFTAVMSTHQGEMDPPWGVQRDDPFRTAAAATCSFLLLNLPSLHAAYV